MTDLARSSWSIRPALDPLPRDLEAFVLLAERLAPAQLASALRLLLDPLQPDGTDTPDTDPYYLELRTLADGDVDLRDGDALDGVERAASDDVEDHERREVDVTGALTHGQVLGVDDR